jgi:hypothetical protein
MKHWNLWMFVVFWAMAASLAAFVFADERGNVYNLGLELEKRAVELSESNLEHFKGRNGEVSDEEQAVLFKSESFLASCRLFLRLTEERSDYFRSGYLRTNLYNAFTYLARSFRDLEDEMKKVGILPYALSDCRKLINGMDNEFAKWPSADNLSYLHQKYVKARDATVYMIERRSAGVYVRHAFKDLGSIFRYNYELNRGKDPWKFLVEVPADTLEKIEPGNMIDLDFEGWLIMEQGTRPNRPVYLIEGGKKRGITSPQVLQRFGGWGRVYEVPVEVIRSYLDGAPVY